MFKSIPARNLVAVYPATLGAGGNPLGLNGNVLCDRAIFPNYEYVSANLVGEHYGLESQEFDFATIYFNGYKGASARPDRLFITKFNGTDVAAELIGSSTASLSLDDIKAITGSLTVSIDGAEQTGTVDLSAATSFSDAAQIIATALTVECEYLSQLKAFVIKSATIGGNSSVSYATGDVADKLFLSKTTGATLSNDVTKDTALTAAKKMTGYSSNFAVISYLGDSFDEALKKDIAKFVTTQNGRYWFVPYGEDPLALVPNSKVNFGAWLEETKQNGITPIYVDYRGAALALGYAASLNFEEENGRTTMAFRSQDGIEPSVTDEADAMALKGNGYSYYGAWATANDRFVMLGNGAVSGDFKWVDNYLIQLFMNSQFELAGVNGLINYKSIPYNTDGTAIMRAVLQDPIDQMVNFGGIRSGVNLSQQQADVLNREVGFDAATQIFTKGWVLSVQLPSAQVRAKRDSFIIKFFYTDGSSLQRIEMTSTNVQ